MKQTWLDTSEAKKLIFPACNKCDGSGIAYKCPECKGKGSISFTGGWSVHLYLFQCMFCEGLGTVKMRYASSEEVKCAYCTRFVSIDGHVFDAQVIKTILMLGEVQYTIASSKMYFVIGDLKGILDATSD